jgi:mono/diheme cytochrome c family protein
LLGGGGAVDRAEPVARKTVREAVYTEAQAEHGKKVYEANCVTCHLPDLDGSANVDAGARGAPLVGTRFVQDFGESKVSALFNKMKRDMPSGRPGTLTDEEYIAAAAFVLQQNKFPAGTTELTEETAGEFWIPAPAVRKDWRTTRSSRRSAVFTRIPRDRGSSRAAGTEENRTNPGRRTSGATLPASSRSACLTRSAPTARRPHGARQRTWCASARKINVQSLQMLGASCGK